MKIARVFPRRTNATPRDALAFALERDQKGRLIWDRALPPKVPAPEVDEVHISVAFTYDLWAAEILAKHWGEIGAPVRVGGPAFNAPGGDFVPGLYLKPGYVITSRGCNNRCVYADGQKCMVPEREGYKLRELPITEGYNVLDDNLLQCSEAHIRAVFDMLDRQKERPVFTGGLEARVLKPWHVEELRRIGTKRLYMAYDTPDDYEPLVAAGKLLQNAGFSFRAHSMCCYVLVGYRGDTMDKANERLYATIAAGFIPFAMIYRDEGGETDPDWRRFQNLWARPASIVSHVAAELKRTAPTLLDFLKEA